jgi:hypothetical protein
LKEQVAVGRINLAPAAEGRAAAGLKRYGGKSFRSGDTADVDGSLNGDFALAQTIDNDRRRERPRNGEVSTWNENAADTLTGRAGRATSLWGKSGGIGRRAAGAAAIAAGASGHKADLARGIQQTGGAASSAGIARAASRSPGAATSPSRPAGSTGRRRRILGQPARNGRKSRRRWRRGRSRWRRNR